MKEEILKKAEELRVRPVDIHNASMGVVSQSQASNWLNGRISAGGVFALMLLFEKIGDGYVPPKTERKERSDKGVPRQGVKGMVERADIARGGAGANPEGTLLPKESDPAKESGQNGAVREPHMPFSDIFGAEHPKKSINLSYGQDDVDGRMAWRYSVQGRDVFFGDGDVIYYCSSSALRGVTHVVMGGSEWPVAKFKGA